MIHLRRAHIIIGLCLLLATGLVGAEAVAKRRPKPKTYKESGSVITAGVGTHESFILTCPEIPPTQGIDAYIVKVPEEFGAKPTVATVTGNSTGLTGEWQLSFYTYGCDQGELYVDAPALVPAGTGFIIVQQLLDVNGSFELTLRTPPR